MTDQMFWFITFLIAMAEIGVVLMIWDIKERQAEKREKRAEMRRRQSYHDYYCRREIERLYKGR